MKQNNALKKKSQKTGLVKRIMIFVVVPFFLLLCVLAIQFVFWEPTDVARGTVAYAVGIPKSVKSLPVYDDCVPALFSHSERDGMRPGAVHIKYQSTRSKAELKASYMDYFKTQGCDWQNADKCPDGKTYDPIMSSIKETGCTHVNMLILGDFY